MPTTAEALASAWPEGTDVATQVPKFSFEYFPPKTAKGVEALYKRVYRMARQNPLFVDLTWGAGGSTSDLTMQMSTNFKKLFGVEVNMHLTCTNITSESVKAALVEAKDNGIRSIVALRGDPPVGSDKWETTEGGFSCALDLVKFIRKEHGSTFALAVSAYPEGHPNVIKEVEDESKLSESEKKRLVVLADGTKAVCHDADFAKEIGYLKEKADAGAELIITQLFFDVDVFVIFVDACRAAGITIPILPGIMPLGTYAGFRRMTGFCKTRVPQDMEDKLQAVKDDNAAFSKFGLDFITDLSKRVWATGKVPALHYYCLNQHETVFAILTALGVKIDPLDSEEDKAKLAEVAAQVKELCAADVAAQEAESAAKKAKIEA